MIEGHGDDSYKYSRDIELNFSSNVYNQLDLTALWQHLSHCLTHTDRKGQNLLSSYPEPEPYRLEQQLARLAGLNKEEVCVTNGATEAIYLIAQTFRETCTAILQPTFSEYADACRMHAHRLTSLYQLPAEAEHFKLPTDVRMLWICNPNNPTGTVIARNRLETLMDANPEVCFVIDQSYESFTLQPLLSPAEAALRPNVLLLHSLTKRYALPGIRLGYITGNAGLLNRLRTNRMPWSVNSMAIEAGLFLTSHPEVGRFDLTACLQEAQRLKQALDKTGGLEVWDTETHYMLARLRYGKAAALKDYLAETHGILIRDASNFEGLDEHYFRVASQTESENCKLVQAIATWFAEF